MVAVVCTYYDNKAFNHDRSILRVAVLLDNVRRGHASPAFLSTVSGLGDLMDVDSAAGKIGPSESHRLLALTQLCDCFGPESRDLRRLREACPGPSPHVKLLDADVPPVSGLSHVLSLHLDLESMVLSHPL